MGIFGWGKKKETAQNSGSPAGSDPAELYGRIAKSVADALVGIHMIDDPSTMLSVEEDGGVFDKVFGQHITEKKFTAMKNLSPDTYMQVSEMHILGCGMHVYLLQDEFKKSVSGFTLADVGAAARKWEGTDSFYCGMSAFGFSMESALKKDLDKVFTCGLQAYKAAVGGDWEKTENLRALMKVMYNAGFTVGCKLAASRNK